MKLSDHITKLAFAFIDKSLPLFYGLGIVIIVIRKLPPEEYGVLVLIQTIYYFMHNINQSLILRPMVKNISADLSSKKWVLTHSIILYISNFIIFLCIITFLSQQIGKILNIFSLSNYIIYLWALFFTFLPKTFSIAILNSQIKPHKVTIIDSIYFIGSLSGIIYLYFCGKLNHAEDVLSVNILSALFSSLIGLFMISPYLKELEFKLSSKRFLSIFTFGKYTFGAGLGTTIYQYSDNYILTSYFSPLEVGIYNSAKVFLRFFNVISQAIIMLVFPVVSKLDSQQRAKDIKAVCEKGILFYTLVLLLTLIPLFIFAPQLLHLVYQDKYPEAATLFRIFLIGFLFHPMMSISASALLGLNLPRFNFLSKMISVPANLLFNIAFIPLLGVKAPAIAAVLYIFAEAMILFFFLRRFTGVSISGILNRFLDIAMFLKKITSKGVR